jgi:hypothetical protein
MKNGVKIAKDFSKYIRDHHLKTFIARIDYLNNLKLDDDTYSQSVINQL